MLCAEVASLSLLLSYCEPSDLHRGYLHLCSAGLLGAVAEGPRATEQFAAVVAVFVAALTASARAQDISARFLEQLAKRLELVRR
jgi:hypothetical protein